MLSGSDEIRLRKAAVDAGFSIEMGRDGDWMLFSGHAPVRLRLTIDGDRDLVALDHLGVANELGAPCADIPPPPGFIVFETPSGVATWTLVKAVWRLAKALPTAPLDDWRKQTAHLGDTETERLEKVRIGQNIFRERLMLYWDGRCPVSGVTHPHLLRASHIIPWKDCSSDADRLDVHNGLLLAAHLDAAFDARLLSFDETGAPILSDALGPNDLRALALPSAFHLTGLTEQHHARLALHRTSMAKQPNLSDL
jgi:hypothetical protein